MAANVLTDALTDTPCRNDVSLHITAPNTQPETYDVTNGAQSKHVLVAIKRYTQLTIAKRLASTAQVILLLYKKVYGGFYDHPFLIVNFCRSIEMIIKITLNEMMAAVPWNSDVTGRTLAYHAKDKRYDVEVIARYLMRSQPRQTNIAFTVYVGRRVVGMLMYRVT